MVGHRSLLVGYKTSQSPFPVPVFLETVSVEFHWSFLSYGNWEWGISHWGLWTWLTAKMAHEPLAGGGVSQNYVHVLERQMFYLYLHINDALKICLSKPLLETRVQLIWLPFPPTLNQNHICYLSMTELMSSEYCGPSENCSGNGDCHLAVCLRP